MHDDRRIESDNVVAQLRHGFPPAGLNVTLQLDAERAIVPEAVDASIDFGGLKNESAPFAEAGEGVHGYVVVIWFHKAAKDAQACGRGQDRWVRKNDLKKSVR